MKTILWFGLAAGCLTIMGGVLGYRPLIAVGSFCLLLALISAAFYRDRVMELPLGIGWLRLA